MTDDDRIDELLREWGSAQRASAPEVRPTPDTQPELHRRRWIAMLSAAALVIALAIALVLANNETNPKPAGAPTSPVLTSPPPPAQKDTQQVTYHHLAITVAASWPINDQQCGSPRSDTVLVPEAIALCQAPPKPGATWAEFGPDAENFSPEKDASRADITVDGAPATKWTYESHGDTTLVIDVPTAAAAVSITSPSRDEAARLAATLQVVDVDAHGCVVEQPYRPLKDTPPPKVPGANSELIPGGPTSLAVCEYDGSLLGGSGVVTGDELAGDLATLRGLDAGLSRQDANDYDPVLCTAPQDLSAAVDKQGGQWFALLVHYASGSTLTLHVRVGLCGDLGVSNGAVTAQSGLQLAELVFRVSHVAGGSAGHLHPAQ